MAVVGFEPTPPQRLEPKSSALDLSATLPQFSKKLSPVHVRLSRPGIHCDIRPFLSGFVTRATFVWIVSTFGLIVRVASCSVHWVTTGNLHLTTSSRWVSRKSNLFEILVAPREWFALWKQCYELFLILCMRVIIVTTEVLLVFDINKRCFHTKKTAQIASAARLSFERILPILRRASSLQCFSSASSIPGQACTYSCAFYLLPVLSCRAVRAVRSHPNSGSFIVSTWVVSCELLTPAIHSYSVSRSWRPVTEKSHSVRPA